MNAENIRYKIIEELNFIPENKLEEIYEFIHYFQLEINSIKVEKDKELLGDESAEELIASIKEHQFINEMCGYYKNSKVSLTKKLLEERKNEFELEKQKIHIG